MAAAKKKPELKAVPDDGNLVKKYAAKIGTAKSAMDEKRMAVASIYQEAEAAGISNGWALKQAISLTRMDPAKARDRVTNLVHYLERLDFLSEDPDLQFTQGDLDLENVEPAA